MIEPAPGPSMYEPIPGEVIALFVVTYCPLDFPGKYVVRRQSPNSIDDDTSGGRSVTNGGAVVADTLAEARHAVPPGLYCMPRYPDDEPHIIEVWL